MDILPEIALPIQIARAVLDGSPKSLGIDFALTIFCCILEQRLEAIARDTL